MNNRPKQNEIKAQIQFWYKSAMDNIQTAEALLKSKRYNFSMFMCQQTVEAVLKCIFVKLKGDRPPYLHRLPRLLVLTGIKVPSWIDKIILRVDAHYIKARYFGDRFDHRIYNRKNASELMGSTKKVLTWFIKKLELEQ